MGKTNWKRVLFDGLRAGNVLRAHVGKLSRSRVLGSFIGLVLSHLDG